MRTVKQLIDEAATLCSSDAALARRIGKSRSQIADMRAGREPVTPETVGLLADVVGLDGEEARRLAALAVCENPKNAERAGVLRRAFFVCLALGVCAANALGNWTVYTLSRTLAKPNSRFSG